MSAASSPAAMPSLLIAVTGAPGSGKSRLLAELAGWHVSNHGQAEGFIAVAGARAQPDQGAGEYRLQLIATGEELPWLVRDTTLFPPYRFNEATRARLDHWAHALPAGSPLVVLDEFGRFEAQGDGLMRLWPALRVARPHILAIAVRTECLGAVEQRLGQKFDLCVAAGAPDALGQLQAACADFGEWTRIGIFGSAAGGIEMSIGTALHLAQVPLRGLAMSSLQGAMMTFTGFGLRQPGRVVWVPFISAGLKALSPGGSRVRPMIAICVQGGLYGGAVQVCGWNILGVTLGGALIGAWAATQCFLLQYLLLGQEMVQAYDAAVLWLAKHWGIAAPGLPWLVGVWASLHALAAGGVALAAWRLRAPPPRLRELIERESVQQPAASVPKAAAAAKWQPLRELVRWQFWLPLVLVSAILLSTGHAWEAIAWLTLRVVVVGVLLLTVLSLLRPARWAEKLRRRGWWGPALAFSGAMRRTGRE